MAPLATAQRQKKTGDAQRAQHVCVCVCARARCVCVKSFAGVVCCSSTVRCVEGARVRVKHHLAKAKDYMITHGQFCKNTAPIAHTHRLAEVTFVLRTIMDFHVSVCVFSARRAHITSRA